MRSNEPRTWGRWGWAAPLLALALAGCGEEAEAEVPLAEGIAPDLSAEVDLPPPPDGIAPAHGGAVLAAGPYPVELAASPNGDVEAWFVGPSAPPPDPVVSVRVPTSEGPRPVMLTWDPERESYRGVVRGPTVQSGPVGVRVVVAGHPYRGRAPQLVVVAPGAPRAPAADVVVVGGEPPPPATVVVEAPPPSRPTVVVEAPPPRPVVVVEPPHPRPGVVVVAPRHPHPRPGVVVVERPRGRVVGRGRPHGRAVRAHGPGRGRGHGRGRRH